RKVPGGDLQRGGGFIEARSEGLAAEISRDPDRTDGSSRRVVIRRGQVQLRLGGSRIARMDRPVDGSGRESSHRSAGTQPKVPIDRGRSGVGDRGGRQDRERAGRSKGDRRWPGRRGGHIRGPLLQREGYWGDR